MNTFAVNQSPRKNGREVNVGFGKLCSSLYSCQCDYIWSDSPVGRVRRLKGSGTTPAAQCMSNVSPTKEQHCLQPLIGWLSAKKVNRSNGI
ncbi:hypothetical protein NQZ68_005628 [Dissostichus eleginoides]|nr:hypothetical protein NQZ68_005628 [Dissostichus eleginoides]